MKTKVLKPNVLNMNSIVLWGPTPVVTEVNGEIILMSLERDRCYGLGATGSDIWRKLREPIRVADLARELGQEYEAQPGEIESDVLGTLRQLADEGLIEVR